MSQRIIVVGGGIAGLAAAEAAKKQDPNSNLTLFSAEKDLPYYRLRVAEVLRDQEQEDKLFLHPASWYEEKGIKTVLGETLKEIKPESKEVVFTSGRTESYDKLILTTGSRSRYIDFVGANRPQVFTLWTLEDAREFSEAIAQQGLKSCAIVGGGVLGMEAAWQLKQRGLKISLLERGEKLMSRQLSDASAEVISNYISSLGIDVYTDADTAEILGERENSAVTGILLKDGRKIDCDAVLLSIGVLANIQAAEDAGLKLGHRIKVDTHMQSSQPDIFAAGDVVEVDDGYWFGLWSISMAEGKVAGNNAAGGQNEFEMVVPPYMVNTLGTRIVSQGHFPPEDEEGVRIEKISGGQDDPYSYKECYYKNDHLVGFQLIGTPAKKEMVKLQEQLKAEA
ncbi:MAG: FAD-dependent oxidoreductase [Eubacteriales bacterium]|nr:FAD-dependent oxidoreductase [Eubacteriales bacterium]